MSKRNILVVEDENITAIDIRSRLETMGFEVSAIASSGEEAIEKAAQNLPDLVLMDIVLKGKLDGIEAASQIRNDLDIPIVYLSAYADDSTLKRAKVSEPFGYILKPYEERELYTAIEMALHKHKLETELKESEEKYRNLVDNAIVGIYKTDLEGHLLFVNEALVKILEYKSAKQLMKNGVLSTYKNRKAREKLLKQIKKSGKANNYELELCTKTGNVKNVLVSATLKGNEITGMILDITNSKQAQLALNESEEKYREIVELAPDGILTATRRGTVTGCNTTFVNLTGFSKEEIIGKNFLKLPTLLKREIPKYIKLFSTIFRGKTTKPIEFKWKHKDGSIRVGEVHATMIKKEGKKSGMLVIIRDITDRKRAVEAIKSSEVKFKSILESSPDAIIVTDLKGNIIECNQVTLDIHHYLSKTELLGKNFFELVAPEDKVKAGTCLQETLEKKLNQNLEYTLITRDGDKFPGEFSVSVIHNVENEPTSFVVISKDITDRKRAEVELKNSEERFKILFEYAPDAYYLSDLDGNFIDGNRAAEQIVGYKKEEIIGKNMLDLNILPKDQIEKALINLAESLKGNPTGPDEYILRSKTGNKVAVEISTFPVKIHKEHLVLGIARDISERKRSQEKIKKSLKEKELLLAEVHHRVKNNMQIISSLLKLQSGRMKNDKFSTLFQESQNRIKSMALVHEKLYRSEDFVTIDFNEYIKTLVNGLYRSYKADSSNIKLEIDINNVTLGIDHAIPCGLIINELVSNSLKYAFPIGKSGTILISLERTEDEQIRLVVDDNGIGIPENVNFKDTESLGLHLINLLVEDQLEGSIKLDRSNGTKFIIKFRGGGNDGG